MTECNPARGIIARARQEDRQALSEADGKALLAAFGIAVPRAVVARDADDAAMQAAALAGPFVAKVVSPDILHKSDAGGVALNLPDADAVRAAVRRHGGPAGDRRRARPRLAGRGNGAARYR